jgi:PAS domain S-box-containing protein
MAVAVGDALRSHRSGATPAAIRIRAASQPYRLVAAVVLVGASTLVSGATPDEQVRFGLVVALGWVPIAASAGFLARRRSGPVVDAMSVAVDLALLVLVQVFLSRSIVPIVGHLLIVADATYAAGRRVGVATAFLGCAVIGTLARVQDPPIDLFTITLYVAVALTLCWLLDVVATDRSRASAGLLRTLEKSDAILTGVAEAVVVTSPNGRIAQWNRAAERTFVCTADEAERRSCSDVLRLRLDVRDLDCSSGCALLCLGGGADVEVWRQLPTGQRQPLLGSAVPVLDASGRVAEVVHSFRDITRLKQADEAKTLFLATASHELKTPLTVIRGFSQMLLEHEVEMDDVERLAALRAIEKRARQLNGIVDRLLMSSRIDGGRIDLALDAVDVSHILAERVSALSSASGREIVLDLGDELPALWADADAVTTITDHLLDNAVKYSPNGGPITVTLSADDDDVALVIADEGVGMTDDQVSHCFDRFWQAEPTDVRRFGGTGIGLYIVRSLVEAMNGRVTVTSAPGHGSAFRVELQRADRRPTPVPDDLGAELALGRGDRSIIREYMRQLGIEIDA